MSFKTEINKIRRSITRGLTKNVGGLQLQQINPSGERPVFTKILICRPNHRLGNLLMLTPLVQEIEANFPEAKIDLFVKGGLAPIIFENYTSVENYIVLPKKPFKEFARYLNVWFQIKKRKYDLVINIDQNSSSGRLSTQFARADFKFFGEVVPEIAMFPDHVHMAKFPVFEFRHYLQLLGYPKIEKEISTLNMKLSTAELVKSKAILDQLVEANKKTICIFTYATGAKCYSTEWWIPFYEKLKNAFPDYNIVEVLPVENVSQIHFAAPSFYSKDVREIASFIAQTSLFIGADSGIMHLACASQTPVFGLFSVTKPEKYEPYGNGSVSINTNELSQEEIIALAQNILKS